MYSSAALPANYQAMKVALKQCDKIDEVKDIGDKHLALATYAKEAADEELLFYAQRIHLRAQARLGELYAELTKSGSFYGSPKDIGISASALTKAVQISKVPEGKRESLIDRTPPISRNALAWEGTIRRPDKYAYMREDAEDAYYHEACSVINNFISIIADRDPRAIVNGLKPDEVQRIKGALQKSQVIEWIDEFDRCLSK